MISLPQNGVWTQPNNSDIFGSLWSSYNIDLNENEGRLRVGKRLVLNTATADQADLTSYAVGFKHFTISGLKKIWTVAGSYVWLQTEDYPGGSGFAKDGVSATPTTCDSELSDIEIFNNELYVTTTGDNVYYLPSGSTWQTLTVTGAGGNPQMLCPFGNRMYLGCATSTNRVVSWSTAHSVSLTGTYTLDTGDNLNNARITFVRSSSNRIWIGTVNCLGGKGYIYEWDGVSTQASKAYRLEASGALSCVIKDDIPYVMDSNGNLLAWTGTTFKKVTGFNRETNKFLYNPISSTNNRFIHPNGMSLVEGKINLLIDNRNYDSTSSVEETIQSGIWEYDETKGLVHKHSVGLTKSGGTISDYGQIRIAGAGAISESNFPDTSSSRNGTLLCGVKYYSNATTTKAGIFYNDSNDTLQKAGYFVTPKIQSQDDRNSASLQNMWQSVNTLYKKFLNSNDKIVVKYRVYDVEATTATITWTSTTTFTTTTDISAYWTSATGGEVEVLNGVGAGKCSHITGYTLAGGTYTVTVDETYTGATGTAIARFQAWTKLLPITYNNPTSQGVTYDRQGIGVASNWIQFKVWMLFTGRDELERLLITNENFNPAN